METVNQAYRQLIETAPEFFHPEVLARLSLPEGTFARDREPGMPRVVIYGQETSGNAESREALDPAAACEKMNGVKKRFHTGNVGSGALQTAFWQAVDEVAQAFGLPDRSHVAMSNLVKVQLKNGIRYGKSLTYSVFKDREIYQLQPDFDDRLQAWQAPLMRAEYEWLAPDFVLGFTGTYSAWMRQLRDGLERESAERGSMLSIWRGAGAPPMVTTWHPGARREASFKRALRARAIGTLRMGGDAA